MSQTVHKVWQFRGVRSLLNNSVESLMSWFQAYAVNYLFSTVSTQTPCTWCRGLHSWGSHMWDREFTTHLHLVPRLRMSVALLRLSLFAYMARKGTALLSADVGMWDGLTTRARIKAIQNVIKEPRITRLAIRVQTLRISCIPAMAATFITPVTL